MCSTNELLRGQYVLSRQKLDSVPEGFRHVRVGTWELVVDTDLSVVPIVGDGHVGCMLGTILDVDSGQKPERIRLRGSEEMSTPERFEETLSRLVGRYVAVVSGDESARVYTDPAGALPVVYDDSGGFVAASPLSIPSVTHESHFRDDLFEAITRSSSKGWLPGKLTYYRDVTQLLPNHYLDLDTWTAVRYWPIDREDVRTRSDARSTVRRIGSELKRAIDAIVTQYDEPKLALTAGKDSRCLLAIARRWTSNGELPLYTFAGKEYRLDMHTSRKITNDVGLDLWPVPVTKATDEQEEQFMDRTGYAVLTENKTIHPTIRRLDADARVEGLGGEIGRGYYWGWSDTDTMPIDAERLLDRLLAEPPYDLLGEEMERWMAEVEPFGAFTTLDLAYQEHRLGCWGGPQHLGLPTEIDYVCPFLTPTTIELMHALPPSIRKRDGLHRRIIGHAWPALNEYPFNAFSGWQRWRNYPGAMRKLRAGITNPGAAMRYVGDALSSR
jgi:hypothetical protein